MTPGQDEQEEDAGDEEERDHDQQPREDRRRPARDGERGDQDAPPDSAPAVDRDLGLASREACKLGDRHEPEAAGAQRGHEALERRDGLRAVAAAVVEEDDAAAPALRRGGGDDRVDSRAAPVLAVIVGQHDVVAAAREPFVGTRLVGGHAARNRRVGRPEQARANPDRSGERVVGEPGLQALLPARERGDVGVRERVVAELEALPVQAAHEVRMPDDLAADDEEGGGHVQAAQARRRSSASSADLARRRT